MKRLTLAPGVALPIEAVTQTFAILGKRGSGKTTTASVLVEELLDAHQQVIVLDPLDVTWGLRSSRNGKPSGFPITVLGGDHADLPLEATAGAVIAEFVVEQRASLILSLRHFSLNDQRRFVTDFAEKLYALKGKQANRSALHLVIDEVDEFAHQRIPSGHERLFGAIDRLVRRGRASGIGVTMISQRPAVIHKDILSQAEVLICHQTISPQDRKALDAWVEAHDAHGQRKTFMETIATLARGEAWIWSPGWLDLFTRAKIRDRKTFDSSATPTEIAAASPALAPVDLSALEARMAQTIDRAKADDPKELKKRIAELERAQAYPPAPETLEIGVPIVDDTDRELIREAVASITTQLEASRQQIEYLLVELGPLTRVADAIYAHDQGTLRTVNTGQKTQMMTRSAAPRGASDLDGAQQKILDTVAMLRDRGLVPTREMVARWLDIHPNGGRYGSNMARLREDGYLDGCDLTKKGAAVAGGVLPTGLDGAIAAFPGGRSVLDVLALNRHRRFTREQLAEALGIHPNGGRYGSTLARLRVMGLIPERGEIALTDAADR